MTKKSTLWLPCSIVLTALISCGGGRAGTAPTQINVETNAARAQASPALEGAFAVPPPVSASSDIPFYSMEGDFRVTLPQGFPAPTHVKQSQYADTGEKTDAYTSRSSRGTCLIAYFEYPESYFAGKDARKLLEFRTDSLVDKTNAAL